MLASFYHSAVLDTLPKGILPTYLYPIGFAGIVKDTSTPAQTLPVARGPKRDRWIVGFSSAHDAMSHRS